MTDQGAPDPHTPRTSSPMRGSTDEAGPGQPQPAVKGEPQGTTTPVEPAKPSPAAEMAQGNLLHRTRASAWYIGLILAAILLILLMIFIAQNSEKVTIHFLGLSGQISVAIALVIAAVVGVLLVAIPGGARMFQLRKRVKGLSKAVLKD